MIDEIRKAAQIAGARIMEIHAGDPKAEYKADGSPVTWADKAAEEALLTALARIAPDIPVVSEENTESHSLKATDRFFLVDPLDGTREFLRRDGGGSFTVNVALVESGVPVLGVVYAPALDRMFCGEAGKGAYECPARGEQAIAIRPVPETGAVAVASRSHRDPETDAWLAANGITETVSIGSSLKFCLVACGEADVYPRFGPTMEWDTAAGDAVLRAAGGAVRNPDGSPFAYGKAGYRNGPFIAYGGFRPASDAG